MPRPPARPETDAFLTRVAWACHIEGLTQGEVADRMSVTRARVNRALGEARRRGIVRIEFATPYAACLEAETALVERFGLSRAVVAPAPADPGAVQDVVGAALGHHLSARLADPALKLVGMAWGGTLLAAMRHVAPTDRPDMEIVSVMGGLTRGSDLNTFEIAKRLAAVTGAPHSYFPAPIYADGPAARDTIMGLATFRDLGDKMRRLDAIVLSAGDLTDRSLLMRHGLPPGLTAAGLAEAGGVGDILGTILRADGREADHPLNERRLGLALDDLARIPEAILASGGRHKVPVLRAALRRRLAGVLVTDEATARALLED